jgi:hypothetical protein
MIRYHLVVPEVLLILEVQLVLEHLDYQEYLVPQDFLVCQLCQADHWLLQLLQVLRGQLDQGLQYCPPALEDLGILEVLVLQDYLAVRLFQVFQVFHWIPCHLVLQLFH